jgi:hypothetical protein
MFKTNIKTLFREIRSIPLESADPDLLAHISFGFRNLLILAYTMPWVTETLGDEAAPHALTARMMEASDRLAKELDKDMTPEDRARCIVYLLHTLSFHYNPDHMEIAENAATEVINNVDLAQKATPATPATEPHQYLSLADSPYICKILCYDYYFRMEKDSRKKAENLLTKWDKELQKNGFWQDVTEDMALQRLEAYSLFSDVADQHKYEKTIRKSIQYYSELPQITDEVRFLFLLAHMGTFRNYPEQVEQIMNNVLEGKLSATATGSISDKVRNAKSNMLKALQFHILALYMLNTEQE